MLCCPFTCEGCPLRPEVTPSWWSLSVGASLLLASLFTWSYEVKSNDFIFYFNFCSNDPGTEGQSMCSTITQARGGLERLVPAQECESQSGIC